MSTKYEYNDAEPVAYIEVAGDDWYCHTFTPLITHDLTMVKLPLFTNEIGGPACSIDADCIEDYGLYGYVCKDGKCVPLVDVVVGIQNIIGDDNHPDGTDLISATFDRAELTTDDETPEGKEIELPKYRVYKDTTYAIVLRMPDAEKGEVVNWWFSGNNYPRGVAGMSDDGGVTWAMVDEADFLFEEWGDPIVAPRPEHSLVQPELLLLLRR